MLAPRQTLALQSLLLSTTLSLACGCAAPEAGGPGAEPPAAEAELPLAGASDARPCGDATVGDVRLPSGNRLTVCAWPDGLEAFREQAPLGAEVALDGLGARPRCGLAVWLALTPEETPVPQALVDACPLEALPDGDALARRAIVAEAVLAGDAALDDSAVAGARANYCGASGQSSFQSSQCYHCNPYDDCVDWCVPQFWGWHDRTMSGGSFLGEEGNIAMERNAACSGKVRIRQYYREDVGDAWQTKIDYWLNPGTSATNGLIYHSAAIFGQDYDLRLRATSDGVGVHRHSGYFLDE